MNNLLDVIGVGIGPFNLGLALMLHEKIDLKFKFFDKKPEFSWHYGMSLSNSKMQIHFLKDLVTPINPTSKFSFLNYLAENGLIYSFLNRDEAVISREEFTKYMKWASASLGDNLHFNKELRDIRFNGKFFEIIGDDRKHYTRHLVVGTGIQPNIPEHCKDMISEKFFHNNEFILKASKLDFAEKRVVIIGGGQSGAEILEHLLTMANPPSKVSIISKRINFGVLEDTPFANELHHPNYVDLFYDYPTESKDSLLREQLLTSDGISKELLFSIYTKLYDLKAIKDSSLQAQFLPNHNLTRASKSGSAYILEFDDFIKGQRREISADIVILATGYKSHIPEFLTNLIPEAATLNRDYSLDSNKRIFIQNFSRKSHGVSDPNLSLVSFRNARIINSIAEGNIYNIDHIQSLIYDKQLEIDGKAGMRN